MSHPVLQKLVGLPHYAPLMTYVAESCGVIARHSPLDREARIDPLELAGQKALRDFGLKFFEDCGWDLSLSPPRNEPTERQTQATSDGASRDQG